MVEVSLQRFDPLFTTGIHLVRNCVDHGLETPDIRSMLEKSKTGSLSIEALTDDTSFQLIIADDGNGIDAERIKQLCLEKNLITESETLDMADDEAVKLIFKPGFSTTETISDISGRGVGMDAVHAVVQEMGGDIKITTELGQGTTFTISVPLM